MISVKQAIRLLNRNLVKSETTDINLIDSFGCILSKNVLSPVSHPLFNCSAVDGYAIKLDSKKIKNEYRVVGEIKAGDNCNFSITQNEAIRIFTGAPVPDSANAVVMQEFIFRKKEIIIIQNHTIIEGQNIRIKGDQIKKGEIAVKKGILINTAVIGFLASIGINKINVYKKPSTTIIVTGNEFAKNSNELKKGKIFESNGIMLLSSLKAKGFQCEHKICEDDKEKLKSTITKSLAKSDLLLITGGVSVGDYDFTRPVLEKLGFKIIFHNVNQKPGKPLLFAKKKNKVVFGLPGNPRSVFVCFFEYVLPYIYAMQGHKGLQKKMLLPVNKPYKKQDNKTHFLAGKIINDHVEILKSQGSHMLQSLSEANCLIVVPENISEIKEGDLLEVHPVF